MLALAPKRPRPQNFRANFSHAVTNIALDRKPVFRLNSHVQSLIRIGNFNSLSAESKDAQYRGFAAFCLDLAKNSPTHAEKTRLLAMAEAWFNLADRVLRAAKHPIRQIADHPLVRQTLGAERAAEAE